MDNKQLGVIPLFKGMPREQIEEALSHARLRKFKVGEAILHQEDPGETFYVILEGTVKISAFLSDGSEVFIALLAAGDTFGEMSMIDSSYRSADVVTQEASKLLSLDRNTFNNLLETSPQFTRNLLKLLARRIRLANVRIQAHCTQDVFGRVARQLVEFADMYGIIQSNEQILIPIRLTQSDISDLVGASRERVNQVMVSFRKTDLLTIDTRHYVTINKMDDLRKRFE